MSAASSLLLHDAGGDGQDIIAAHPSLLPAPSETK
jgi:hypothetical protein